MTKEMRQTDSCFNFAGFCIFKVFKSHWVLFQTFQGKAKESLKCKFFAWKMFVFFSEETLQIYKRPRAFKRENFQRRSKSANRAKMDLRNSRCNSRNILKWKWASFSPTKLFQKLGRWWLWWWLHSLLICVLSHMSFEVVVRALIA